MTRILHRARKAAWMTAWAACACLGAAAQAQDAGLVTQLQGQASYAGTGAPSAKVTPLMKIRPGDRITLPASATLKLVYFRSATAETWTGPASGTIGEAKSENTTGQIASAALPGAAPPPRELNRIANIGRIGAVAVRSLSPPERDIKAARERYDGWRAQSAPDDLLPDLYLYAVYEQYKCQGDMHALALEMQKRVPGSEEVGALVSKSAQNESAKRGACPPGASEASPIK